MPAMQKWRIEYIIQKSTLHFYIAMGEKSKKCSNARAIILAGTQITNISGRLIAKENNVFRKVLLRANLPNFSKITLQIFICKNNMQL